MMGTPLFDNPDGKSLTFAYQNICHMTLEQFLQSGKRLTTHHNRVDLMRSGVLQNVFSYILTFIQRNTVGRDTACCHTSIMTNRFRLIK